MSLYSSNSRVQGVNKPILSSTQIPTYIFCGQSNTVGDDLTSNFPSALRATIPNAKFIYNADRTINAGATIETYHADTLANNISLYSTKSGSDLNFAYLMNDYLNREFLIIKLGVGSTSLGGNWKKTGSGEYQNLLTNYINKAASLYTAAGKTLVYKAIFWIQGEQDANQSNNSGGITYAADYQSNLTTFISNWRTDLSASSLPFIISSLHDDIDKAGYFEQPTIFKAQVYAKDNLSNVYLVNTNNLTIKNDWVHYTYAGSMQIGNIFFQIAKDF